MNKKNETIKKTLFIALHRDQAIRMILQTELFNILNQCSWLSIVILSPYSKDKIFGKTFYADNVKFEHLKTDKIEELKRSSLLYRLMHTVRLFTYRESKKMISRKAQLREYELNSSGPKISFFGRIYNHAIPVISNILAKSKFLRKKWFWLEGKIFADNSNAELFNYYKPDWMIISSIGYGYDAHLIWQAEKVKTKILSIIQSWDNTTTKGYGGLPNSVVAWSKMMRNELIEYLDIPENRIFVGGVPHWDEYFLKKREDVEKNIFIKKHNLSKERKIIYFPTSSIKMFRKNVDVIKHVVEAIHQGKITTPAQLLVRLHPNYYDNKRKWKHAYQKEFSEIDAIVRNYPELIRVDEKHFKNVSELIIDTTQNKYLMCNLRYSDVMINCYSTQAIEAAIFDLPIINMSFGWYKNTDIPNSILSESEHYGRVIRTGGILDANNYDKLIEGINFYLQNPTYHQAQRRKIVEQEFPENRGCSGTAVGNHIIKIFSFEN
jgi:hypothetical protein